MYLHFTVFGFVCYVKRSASEFDDLLPNDKGCSHNDTNIQYYKCMI